MAVIYNRRAFIVFASFLPMWDFYFYIFEAIWQRFDQAPGGLKVRRVHTGVNSAKHILVVIYRLVKRAAVIFGIKICSNLLKESNSWLNFTGRCQVSLNCEYHHIVHSAANASESTFPTLK